MLDQKIINFVETINKQYKFLPKDKEGNFKPVKYDELLEDEIREKCRNLKSLIINPQGSDPDEIKRCILNLKQTLKARKKTIKIINQERTKLPEDALKEIKKRIPGKEYIIQKDIKNIDFLDEDIIHRIDNGKISHIRLHNISTNKFLNESRFGISEEEEVISNNMIIYSNIDDDIDFDIFEKEFSESDELIKTDENE